jgi:potassium/hydrogen antiporter
MGGRSLPALQSRGRCCCARHRVFVFTHPSPHSHDFARVVTESGVGVELQRNERAFILFAGLKGAVPILLGEFLRAAHVPQAEGLYGIVVVVVAFSVLVQGSSVPLVARLLHLPMRTVAPEPWAVGVRLRDEPHGVHRLTVVAGSAADGWTIENMGEHAGDIWVSIVVRASGLVPVRAETRLQAGDDVVILADPELGDTIATLFTPPRPTAGHPQRQPGTG